MRTRNRLSEKIISALVPSERDTKHFDGAGLHIRVLPNGSRYWHLKFKRADGKESLKSLGKWPDVDCAAARAKAAVVRAEIAAGQAPTRDRRPETVGNHFNAVAETWLQSRHQWTDKHAHDVARRLNRYVSPRIGDKPMASITLADVTRLLVTVSEQRPVAARKILEHLERIFGFAEVNGRGPQSVLTDSACDSIRKDSLRKPDKTQHHAYMSHEDVPGFWKKLNTLPDTPAKLGLQFLILNASRTNEVRGAKISELSADGATWTVSADRMKQRIAHAVPMSQQSQEIVKRARKLAKGSSFLFSSAGINATAMLLLLKGIEPGVTCHGFRSAFSDWANLRRENRDVIERILSHGSADKIRSSYFRNPMHGDRRALLGRWADHVTGARRRDKAGSR